MGISSAQSTQRSTKVLMACRNTHHSDLAYVQVEMLLQMHPDIPNDNETRINGHWFYEKPSFHFIRLFIGIGNPRQVTVMILIWFWP